LAPCNAMPRRPDIEWDLVAGDDVRGIPHFVPGIEPKGSVVKLLRRLETGYAAERRRDAHRPAGIRADTHHRLAVGYRHRRPGGGAARDQAAVIRIAGCAVVGVDSDPGEGELGHVGAADQHRARSAQTRDRRRVMSGRWRVVERLRPGEGPFAGDIEQVLDRDRKSGERGGDIARLA